MAAPMAIACVGAAPAVAADPLLAPVGACPGQTRLDMNTGGERATMVCMVNWARRAAGLRATAVSWRLTRSAQLKANLIARCGTLTHEPCGQRWDRVLDRVGFRGLAFENLASGSGGYGTVRGAMRMWLGSPGHRSALLSRAVTRVGVGVRLGVRVDGWVGSVWAVHLGRPM